MNRGNQPASPGDQQENLSGGRIEVGGEGAGNPSDASVADRALEIAEIEGRPGHATPDDYERAYREIRGGVNVDEANQEGREESADARDPAESHGDSAIHRRNLEPDDEQTAPDLLVREGVEEADHEQMLEARREAPEGETEQRDLRDREGGVI